MNQQSARPIAATTSFISSSSEMGERTRSFDWSKTPLGPIENWPQSLKIAVRIMLDSRYAMWLGWGLEFTFFYNDAYARMTLGPKHPWALGRSAREVWAEIWNDIGPRAESVVSTGQATWDEGLLLFLERKGFPEETYHTFSYSPIPDDLGRIGGMLCVVTEDTERTIGERRLRTLRELAARTSDQAKSAEEACQIASRAMAENQYDLPFALIYLFEENTARLAGSCGLAEGSFAAPGFVDLGELESLQKGWLFSAVLKSGRSEVVADLRQRFGALPAGVWPEPPEKAVILPVMKSGQTRLAGFVVAGISPRLEWNDEYRGFLELMTSQVASAVTNAMAFEEERRRAEALAELDRAKTAFFSNVSHEFRTPLTLMLGPVEELLNERHETLSPAIKAELEIVNRNGRRLQRLVNALLDFSRIEAGRVKACYEATDLAALTADLASNFRSACEKAGLKLTVDCPPLTEPVFVDRSMWEKVVLNLLSNAFKFTFEGEIRVELRNSEFGIQNQDTEPAAGALGSNSAFCTPHSAILTVKDTGTGIPSAEMPRLFERFHRIVNARGRTHEGSGIGLAMVQELVKLHGGSIEAESQVGRGTSFIVSIPLGSAHLPAEQIGNSRTATSTSPGASPFVEELLRWIPDRDGNDADRSEMPHDRDLAFAPVPASQLAVEGRPHVLIADDNADMRQYILRLLADQYRVEAVPDGEAALAAVRERTPDLILTDVMMPRLDGFGLLRELRAHPHTCELPVIMLSARAGEESRIEGMEAGADDYLIKPFSGRELVARVEALLQIARLRRASEKAIRKSEERLRTGLAAARMVAWEWTPDDGALHVSDNAAEMFGLPDGSELNTIDRGLTLVHPDDVAAYRETFQRAIAERGSYLTQYRLVRPNDGVVLWMEERGHAVREGPGGTVRLFGVVMDITERKQAERERLDLLRELETQNAFIKAVIAQVPAAIVVADADTDQIRVTNEEAHRIVRHAYEPGKRLKDYGNTYIRDAFRPDGSRYVTGQWPLDRSLRGETIVAEEIDLRLSDESRVIVRVNAAPIRVGEKVVAGVVAFHDVTDRKRAEQSSRFLADASAALAGLVDYENTLQRVAQLAVPGFADWAVVDMVEESGSPRRLVVAHTDPTKVDLAQSLHRRFSRAAANILRTGCAELQNAVTDEMLQTAARDENDLRLLRELGPKSYIGVPLKVQGKVVGVLTFIFASSGRLYGENDLAVANDLASRASIAIENSQLYARLKEADRRKDEFLATLAHELRNPLAPIRNGLQLLRLAGGDSVTAEKARTMMERQLGQMVRLVDDLMDVSRINQGKLELRKERLDLAAVLNSAVETSRPLVEQMGHDLEVVLPPQPVVVEADLTRLAQVFSNLLTNAAKYTERGGRITLAAERHGGDVLVAVRDTGIGIAADQLPRIFEMFSQVTTALERSQGGLGIGLALVKRLVGMHGGRIEVRSDGPGKGSEFVVHLPAVVEACRTQPQTNGGDAKTSLRILVVDDNRDAADSLADMLGLMGGETRMAYDGEQAVAAADEFRPDVILLDIGLPKLNGYEACRCIREQANGRKMVLIAQTGWGQDEDRQRTREAGFDHHLVKPVDPVALMTLLAGLSATTGRR